MKTHIEYEVGDKILFKIGSYEQVGIITYRAGHMIYGGFVIKGINGIEGKWLRDWNQIKPYKKTKK